MFCHIVILAILSSYASTCGAAALRGDTHFMPQERKLFEIVPCPGGGPVYYFNVDIQLTLKEDMTPRHVPNGISL